MKFENPIMTISMFEVENVLTASGAETTGVGEAGAAADAAIAAATGAGATAKKITITF